MVGIEYLLFGPLTFVAGVLLLSAGYTVLRGRLWPESRVAIARGLVVVLCVWGVLLAAATWNKSHDLTWLWWAVQIPLVSLFLTSGVFSAGVWSADHGPDNSSPNAVRGPHPFRGPLTFFAFTVVLAIEPLVLEVLSPLDPGNRRVSGAPAHDILQLASWSFGGALPDCLVPFASEGIARGVGFPPRDVTVPMGSLLIAAWTSIAFVAVALVARCLPSRPAQLAASVMVPPALGTVFLFVTRPIGAFDPRFFGPESCFDSGIWRSDPPVMRTFGFVLAAAVVSVAVFVFALVREQRAAIRDLPPAPQRV
jgi:hypothetical protein